MKDFDQAIKERREAIVRLQAELKLLESARLLLNGGTTHQVSLGEILGARDSRPKIAVRHRPGKTRRGISPKSTVGQTVTVLREAGVSLHVSDILGRLKKRGVEAQKLSLQSSLAKMSKRGQVFARTNQPNTFGLREWEQAKAPTTG